MLSIIIGLFTSSTKMQHIMDGILLITGIIIIIGINLIPSTQCQENLIVNLRNKLQETSKDDYIKYFIELQKNYEKLQNKKETLVNNKNYLNDNGLTELSDLNKQLDTQYQNLKDNRIVIDTIWKNMNLLDDYIVVSKLTTMENTIVYV